MLNFRPFLALIIYKYDFLFLCPLQKNILQFTAKNA